ncbi:metallophosphoesterase [Spirochaetia bacterium]|nr:metallophosphoesterase [Spirochaetia bacterium]
MKVLYIAEIVGKAGVFALKKSLNSLKQELKADFVIACGDGATGGKGLGRQHASYIRKLGCDVVTTGDFCFYKKDLVDDLDNISYVLRPSNLSAGTPGRGVNIFKVKSIIAPPPIQTTNLSSVPAQTKIAVVVLLGQSGFTRFHAENPLPGLAQMLNKLREQTPYVIVDYHAAATAEKQTMFYAADGLCSAVIGSHCRVLTADERILERGTAVISDAGRTGSQYSVGGCEIKSALDEFISGIPQWKKEAWECIEIQGVLIELDSGGNALSIQRVRKAV